MGVLRQVKAQVVGIRRDEELDLPSFNHIKQASLTPAAQKTVKANGLQRVAGNIFISHSTQDFWKVSEGGKVVRLTKTVEVDNGESIAAPTGDPRGFLADALQDLSF